MSWNCPHAHAWLHILLGMERCRGGNSKHVRFCDERYKLRIFHHALRRTLQARAMEKLTKGQQTS